MLAPRQFVLIDHSIEDSSGHYLEYARRVLRAAKKEGFKTVLACNKRAKNLECPEADVIYRTFSKTFWENQTQDKLQTVVGFIRKKSTLAGDPFLARQFAKEISLFVDQCSITEKDIVFVPTLGGIELIGISLYSGLKAAKDINWHLLFRRDVPSPTSLLDPRGYVKQAQVTSAFLEANLRFKKGSRRFYTDTEELTNCYVKLGVGKFKTLPVPIDEEFGFKKVWHGGPLYVSYLGDMREKRKGIHLLPKLIAAVRKSGLSEEIVRFKIQGNFPAYGASRGARSAKLILNSRKNAGVDVIEGPFDSKTYRELIRNSDIVLLPYSAACYQARSSGIFSEALAAGVPTIFPRASWMEKNSMGSQSAGFRSTKELATSLIKLVHNYSENQRVSLAYSKQWREQHSANRLIHLLLEDGMPQ